MNRADIKMTIDQLTCLDVSEADAGMVEAIITSLERLGNEHAQVSLENQIGKEVNGSLMAELGEKNDQIVQLRNELARYKEREQTMGWNQK